MGGIIWIKNSKYKLFDAFYTASCGEEFDAGFSGDIIAEFGECDIVLD